ncbi:MAG: phosphotransferase, partial [Octadecabacter sp.]
LDFQDALLAPPAYDLVSLLRDARRDISPQLRANTRDYFARQTGMEPTALGQACAVLGVQRNLRILGIFARLAQRDGKRRYIDLIPRVWAHLMDDLDHPDLKDLREIILRVLPEPDAETLLLLGKANA